MDILSDLGITWVWLLYKLGNGAMALGFLGIVVAAISFVVAMEDSSADELRSFLLKVIVMLCGLVAVCVVFSVMSPNYNEVKMAAAYSVAKKVGGSDEAREVYEKLLRLLDAKVESLLETKGE